MRHTISFKSLEEDKTESVGGSRTRLSTQGRRLKIEEQASHEASLEWNGQLYYLTRKY